MEFKKKNGIYYFEDNGEIIAEMTYSMAGEKLMIIDHTYVDDNYRGESLGKKLLYELVDFARSESIEIIPLCPFAKSVFDKEEAIRDVLRKI